jgi:hypothetical protein
MITRGEIKEGLQYHSKKRGKSDIGNGLVVVLRQTTA